MAEMQPLFGKKGKANSVVLKHFGFEESDSGQTKISCKIRHTTVSAPQENTTNLFNHLKSTHRVIHDQKERKNALLLSFWVTHAQPNRTAIGNKAKMRFPLGLTFISRILTSVHGPA